MTIFNQDFRTPGSEVITNFDPGQEAAAEEEAVEEAAAGA